MKQGRSERIDSLLEEALSREPAARASFLVDTCAGDEALLREVSSLLRCHERAGSFLETPFDLARGLETALGWSPSTFAPGDLLSARFEIVRLRAHGGMGEVYEAFDRSTSTPTRNGAVTFAWLSRLRCASTITASPEVLAPRAHSMVWLRSPGVRSKAQRGDAPTSSISTAASPMDASRCDGDSVEIGTSGRRWRSWRWDSSAP